MSESEIHSLDFKGLTARPRAIAIDLDGTLLNSITQLSARNRSAIEACIAQGLPVIIATSRPARIFNRIFPKDLAATCSLVVMNGAIAIGRGPLSGYFREPLAEITMREIIALALEFNPDAFITIEIDGYEFGINWFDKLDTEMLWQRNSATPDMVFSIEEALAKQPCKIALSGNGTNILKLTDRLNQRLGNAISIVPSLIGIPMLNITSAKATKPSALRKLLSPAGISLDEVIAFGDDIPDIGMLQECGIPVAMANSFPEVKAVCRYQTASNDEDGVACVLEQVFLKGNGR